MHPFLTIYFSIQTFVVQFSERFTLLVKYKYAILPSLHAVFLYVWVFNISKKLFQNTMSYYNMLSFWHQCIKNYTHAHIYVCKCIYHIIIIKKIVFEAFIWNVKTNSQVHQALKKKKKVFFCNTLRTKIRLMYSISKCILRCII